MNADQWDSLIASAMRDGNPEALMGQMVRLIRELGGMCEWADGLFGGEDADSDGYNWRAAWRGMNR